MTGSHPNGGGLRASVTRCYLPLCRWSPPSGEGPGHPTDESTLRTSRLLRCHTLSAHSSPYQPWRSERWMGAVGSSNTDEDVRLAEALAELARAEATIIRLDDALAAERAETSRLRSRFDLLAEAVMFAVDGATAALGPCGPGDGTAIHGQEQVPLVVGDPLRAEDGDDDLVAAVLPLVARTG